MSNRKLQKEVEPFPVGGIMLILGVALVILVVQCATHIAVAYIQRGKNAN